MSESPTKRRSFPATPPVTGPVREWLAVDVGGGESLSAADLLRLLEGLRTELSCRLVGSPGAFIGYDTLAVPQGTVTGPGRVLLEARLAGWSDRLHHVEYVAVSAPSGAERPASTDPLLVRGAGRTLHVECRRRSGAPATQAAPPTSTTRSTPRSTPQSTFGGER